MFNPRTCISNGLINEIFDRCNGNRQQLHTTLCHMTKIDKNNVNISSLYTRVRTTVAHLKRLKKHYGNGNKFQDYRKKFFCFPIPRPSVVQAEQSKVEKCSLQRQVDHVYHLLQLKTDLLRQKTVIINNSKTKLKRQEQTIRKLKNQISENDSKKDMEYIKLVESKHKQYENLSKVIKDSKKEKADLYDNIENQFDANNNDNEIVDKMKFKTRDSSQGRPFNSHIRQIYYFMRSHGVGVQHIGPILKYILNLFNIEYSELPSCSSALLFDKEMNILAKEQMSEIINENDNLTMHRDATTKSGRHFYAVELSNANTTYTLGLQELADGRAETYAKTTDDMISDINDVCTDNPTGNLNIMSKIKNFMTDRSATEEKTNRILMETSNNNTINSFKCSVHPLIQFWDVCDKNIKEIEKGENFKLRDGDKNRKDTYISILLNSVSKLFFKDGSGDPTMSNVYLKSQGIDQNPIEKMRGSRFNVQFHNAGGIFILKHVILNYLLQSKMALNYTQQLIVDCLQNKTLICICQALGMICKTITGPYWKSASEKKTPIEMGHIYCRLVDVLDNIVKSPSLLYDNHIKLFFGPEKDCHDVPNIFIADENRDKTELFISKLCSVIMEKAKKLFSDFLCGGKYFNADDDLKTTARTCPSNNITVERLMGKLDSAIKQSPNSSVGAIETKIVYNNNKTHNWLDSKSNSDKKVLLKSAIKNRKQVTLDRYLKKTKLFNNRVKIINQRIECKEKQLKRKSEKKATVKKTIEENGIWNFEIELETELDKLRTKTEKIKALKTQINLYKDDQVLDISKIDKSLLIFSKKGKPLSLLELSANLRKLMCHRNPFNDPESLVNKEIIHTWEDDDTSEQSCWNGRLQSYQNQEFEVKYWKENEELEDGDLYNLSLTELKEDYQGKLLKFKD